MLDSLQHWLEGSALSGFVNWSSWVWPVSESLHFLGFALLYLVSKCFKVDLEVAFGSRRSLVVELILPFDFLLEI